MAQDSGEATSEFPLFSNGDVKIIITGSRQYLLHSATLKDVSPLLRGMLEDENMAKLSAQARRKGVKERFRLVAEKVAFGGQPVDLILKPVRLDNDGKPERGEPVGLDLENGRIVDPYVTVSRYMYSCSDLRLR